MPRSRQSRAARVAEKMLRDAIVAETIALQAELSAERRENDRLRKVLADIGRLATAQAESAPAAQMATAVVELPPELRRQLEQPPEPVVEPAPIELADEDNLGEGRWA